jgi:formylglycine-generating enzyme required for sulfatase activity
MKDIIRQLLLCILVFSVTISTSRADQYLFLVGVQDYSQGGDLRPLSYAEEDVHKLAAVFSKYGVRDDHIVLMTKRAASTESGARFLPNSELINKELELLLNQLRPEDSIIVGFSGHGLQLKGDSTNYFCPINAELAPDRKDTLISIPKVFRMLSACKANTKLLLVDACRNDPLSSSSKSTRRIEIEPVFSRPAPVVAGGTVAIFSCSATEQSFEDETIKSGIFFHFITLGLSGDADINGDGIVDVNDLETFTTDRVRNWARDKLSKSQTPERQGESRGRIELIRLSKRGQPRLPPKMGIDNSGLNIISNSVGMRFAQVPAGNFTMGSPREENGRFKDESEHQVTISNPFFIAVTEVTQNQYQSVTKSQNPSGFRQPQQPVENVSWDDAVRFCDILSAMPEEKANGRSYRLPTEAEWEYACRAGSQSSYHFGDAPENLGDFAWFIGNTKAGNMSTTFAVGQKHPNAFGLFDMHGNVWEWCSDFYAPYPLGSSKEVNLQGPKLERVLRGGSYQDNAKLLRSATRLGFLPAVRKNSIGFRIVMDSK